MNAYLRAIFSKIFTGKNIINIYFNAPGARPWSVLACVLVAGFMNMMSMGAILPAISQMGGDGVSSNSRLNQIIVDVVEFFGLSPTLISFVLFLGVVLTLKSILALASMVYVAASVSSVQAEIRSRLLGGVMRARWGYFVDLPPGHIANSIGSQTMHAGDAYLACAMVLVSTIQAIALLIAATLVSGYMVILTAIAAIIISTPLYKMIKYAREAGAKQWERAGQLGSKVQDAVGNMKAIKSMNRGGPFSQLFYELVAELRGVYFMMIVSRYALSHGQDIMVALTIVAGFYVGTQMVEIPLADLLVLGIIYYQVITLVKQIQEHLQGAAIAQGAYFSLMDMIEKAEHNVEPNRGTHRIELKQGCAFRNVNFAYNETPVLRDVNLEIEAGQVTVLLGPSGAGKTTIIDLLIGLLSPQEGLITIDGIPVQDVDMNDWRNSMGYVPQELTLLHGTIYDNVTLGDDSITKDEVWSALKSAGAEDFIQKLPDQLDTHIGNMGSKLSGGQRQRLSLARALVRKPAILVLDEVTSALDEATEAEICRNIAGLGNKYTIVAITHRPAWTKIASRLYRVHDGQVEPVSTDADG